MLSLGEPFIQVHKPSFVNSIPRTGLLSVVRRFDLLHHSDISSLFILWHIWKEPFRYSFWMSGPCHLKNRKDYNIVFYINAHMKYHADLSVIFLFLFVWLSFLLIPLPPLALFIYFNPSCYILTPSVHIIYFHIFYTLI